MLVTKVVKSTSVSIPSADCARQYEVTLSLHSQTAFSVTVSNRETPFCHSAIQMPCVQTETLMVELGTYKPERTRNRQHRFKFVKHASTTQDTQSIAMMYFGLNFFVKFHLLLIFSHI